MSEVVELSRKPIVSKIFDPELSDPTRVGLVGELLSGANKEKKVDGGELNRLGQRVRYYRLIGSGEAEKLLSGVEITSQTNPTIQEDFRMNAKYLLKTLDGLFQREAIGPERLVEFNKLKSAPTLDYFIDFCLHSIPRFELFRLHVGQVEKVNNYFGLLSLSVGIPFLEPTGFKKGQNGVMVGSALAEYVIPSVDVIVHPPSGGLRETEKEVDVLSIKPEWLVDLFISPEDFASRYIADPSGPLYDVYQDLLKNDKYAWVPYHAHDFIMDYKREHPFEDLIPISKIPETDPENPILKEPILK